MRRVWMWLIVDFFILAWLATRGAPKSPVLEFNGQCDASAAVALDDDRFVVADDEDNVLRVYRMSDPGLPVTEFDLSDFLRIEKKGGEADIEGGCRIGQRLFFITSHGRNRKGKDSPDRQRFFAVDFSISKDGVEFRPAGDPYTQLISDLATAPQLRQFGLAVAAQDAPKHAGALNIEGLCAMPDGSLLIGFRNPIPEGRTLVVPLTNPSAVIAGKDAQFGQPILLDLNGLGVRSLGTWRNQFLIIAGSYDTGGMSRLYTWPGPGAPAKWVQSAKFKGLNPEGMTFDENSPVLHFISDDGSDVIAGKPCKSLKNPIDKRFRVYRMELKDPSVSAGTARSGQ